jgi:hypothetical protein
MQCSCIQGAIQDCEIMRHNYYTVLNKRILTLIKDCLVAWSLDLLLACLAARQSQKWVYKSSTDSINNYYKVQKLLLDGSHTTQKWFIILIWKVIKNNICLMGCYFGIEKRKEKYSDPKTIYMSKCQKQQHYTLQL